MFPTPVNEAERLAKLQALTGALRANISNFQNIANAAKEHFNVPIALVSVIDATHQVYLGNCGIAAPNAPRDMIFCNYTILSNSLVVVEDTWDDTRFSQHPFVLAPPRLRFYAGAPLIWEGELRLGTVCLADSKPRSFLPGQRLFLEHLARKVVESVKLMRNAPAGGLLEGRADPYMI